MTLSNQSRHCRVDFTSSLSSSKLCLLTAEDSDERRDYRTLALPFYTQRMICCLTVVLLLEVYTLPKAHFMEQLTRSKHPINEHDTKQNRARLMLSIPIQTAERFLTAHHTFTEINMYYLRPHKHLTFSCFSQPGSTSMCPNTKQKSCKL